MKSLGKIYGSSYERKVESNSSIQTILNKKEESKVIQELRKEIFIKEQELQEKDRKVRRLEEERRRLTEDKQKLIEENRLLNNR
jgi:hypothetical protein